MTHTDSFLYPVEIFTEGVTDISYLWLLNASWKLPGVSAKTVERKYFKKIFEGLEIICSNYL